MSDVNTSIQLLASIAKQDLYSKLIFQLNKDFQLAGVADEFSLELQPGSLRGELVDLVSDLIRNRFSDYLNVLYRIDISESQIKRMDGSDIRQLSEEVAVLILIRECQKVLIRNKL